MVRQPDILATDRLVIRRPRPQDAPGVLAILADPRVVEHNPSDRVTDLGDIDALIARWLQHWDAHGFGNACVVERTTGRLVGSCGLRRMTVHDRPVLNLMYRLAPDCWGRGYATEAAGACLAWAREHLPDEVVLARIRPTNAASQRVAARLGLVRDPGLDDLGEDGLDLAFTSRVTLSRGGRGA